MPTEEKVQLNILVPADLKENLKSEAAGRGMSLNAWMVQRLNAALASETWPNSKIGETPGAEQPDPNVVPIDGKADPRNERHYSPTAEPLRHTARHGFEMSEVECDAASPAHPKPHNEYSYMTTCKRCGRRLR